MDAISKNQLQAYLDNVADILQKSYVDIAGIDLGFEQDGETERAYATIMYNAGDGEFDNTVDITDLERIEILALIAITVEGD